MVEFDTYERNHIVIHGNASRAYEQGYQVPYPYEVAGSGHYNGNPAFCMYLRLEDFKRNPDLSVQCTIKDAYLNKFPAQGTHYFSYGFEMYAAFYIGELPSDPSQWDSSKIWGSTHLFWKKGTSSGGPKTWSEYYCRVQNITIYAPNPNNEKVHFLLFNQSYCTCNQAYNDRPVFVENMDPYIPSVTPYVWQMQNTGWHLVRPFYVVRQKGGQKYWFSIEDAENPVYNMDGTPYSPT